MNNKKIQRTLKKIEFYKEEQQGYKTILNNLICKYNILNDDMKAIFKDRQELHVNSCIRNIKRCDDKITELNNKLELFNK